MSLETKAYVCPEKGAKLSLQTITLPPLKTTQCEIKMECCGLCHTDISMRDNQWGVADYPLVAGHEGVGIISTVGAEVKNLKVGDRVGVAWIRDSCRSCSACGAGRENICQKGYQGTFLSKSAGCWGSSPDKFNEHGGCFSQVMRVEEKFCFKIPENLESNWVAPMMCGGATVWEPLIDYVKPGSKVGVVSIGGLGTAAIKLAKLQGAIITAFSRGTGKKGAALACGAHSFVDLKNEAEMKAAAGSLDLIIDTCPVNSDVGPFMDLLTFDGVYCRVGIPHASDQGLSYNWIPLIFTQKKIVGSIVLGSARMNQMLDVVSANKAFMQADMPDWKIQEMPFDQINEAMEQLLSGATKGWRVVLKW